MKISLDVDGVLANFTDAAWIILRDLGHPVPPRGAEPTDWNWISWGATPDLMKKVFQVINDLPNFWTQSRPYLENVHALRNFLTYTNTSQEVFFTTARALTRGLPVAVQTRAWLEKYDIWTPRNTFRNHLTILHVEKTASKAVLFQALGITHSVDDHGPTVMECEAVPGHTAVLLDRPWNQEYQPKHRVKSLADFFAIVYAEGKNG